MRANIVVVAAEKGGVGKTTLAIELAASLNAILIDLDFHGGGASDRLGIDPTQARRPALVRALEVGPDAQAPRPRRRAGRPALVASHPDLGTARLDEQDLADCIRAWAQRWQDQVIVIDTHPGAHWTSDGAMQTADLILVPVPPGAGELSATRRMLEERRSYPIALVPNIVPPVPAQRYLDALGQLREEFGVAILPPISEHRWLRRRVSTSAISLLTRPGVRTRRASDEFHALADATAKLLEARRHEQHAA